MVAMSFSCVTVSHIVNVSSRTLAIAHTKVSVSMFLEYLSLQSSVLLFFQVLHSSYSAINIEG